MEEEEDMNRSDSTAQVFQSKFMMKFTANLENVIRTDIKDENIKTDLMLRSVASYIDERSPAKMTEGEGTPKASGMPK